MRGEGGIIRSKGNGRVEGGNEEKKKEEMGRKKKKKRDRR